MSKAKPTMNTTITYPAGAMLRAGQICTLPATDKRPARPGLLPINKATWYKWIKAGRVRAGKQLTPKTVVWPLEYVLSLRDGACTDSDNDGRNQ